MSKRKCENLNDTIVNKGIFTSVTIVFSFMYNSMGVLFVILLIAMGFDYITGIAAGFAQGKLSSRIGIVGIVKKFGYVALVFTAMLLDLATIHVMAQLGYSTPLGSLFGVLTIAWLFTNEGISIVENLGRMGVPIPPFLEKGFQALKRLIEKNNDKNDEGESK